MNDSSLARRYTRAFVQTLETEGDFHAAQTQLLACQHVLDADPALKTAMQTFLLPAQKKIAVVELLTGELRLAARTARFLQVLVEANRLVLLPLIIGQLEELWYATRGIERITVYSAMPLADEQRRCLRAGLQRLYGREVTLQQAIDPGLLAGIKIQRGSVFHDFSLQGNLNRLKQQISEEK